MNLLAIDSASCVLSVAVSGGDDVFHVKTEEGMKCSAGCSELVMDLIDGQMKKAGLSPEDLNGVLCMGGPGSFTGLRIGYSIAKGLSLSLNIPFAPVPTLDCMADSVRALNCPLVMPLASARKGSFFYSLFNNGKKLLPDTEASAVEIEAIIEKNPGVRVLQATAGYAVSLIEIAKKEKLFERDNSEYLFAGPEYIRKTDAELSLTQ